MGSQGKLACCLAIILATIVVAHSSPTGVAYKGDRCECPTKLDFQIYVPRTPKPKKYTHAEYGYKVDVPTPGKAHVTYTFDFTVEEPHIPKPPKPSKWNLYAKVDRVAPYKEDCYEDSYAPAPPSGCKCCQYDSPPRYVYKKVQPCKCQQPNCICNQRRAAPPATSPNMFTWSAVMGPMLESNAPNSIRRKRDTHDRTFFRRSSRNREGAARPVRYVKLYHKNLNDKRNTLFDYDAFANPKPMQSKRKTKKVLLPHLYSRKVKRDIKGEYDLLEKEHEQADLTLPEIVQYMPETLRPDFKRGQCAVGCRSTATTELEQREEYNSLPTADDNTETSLTAARDGEMRSTRPQDDEENVERNEQSNSNVEERHSDERSTISNSLMKRNAADYNRDIPPSYAASAASPIRAQPLPSSTSYGDQSAYNAKPPQSYQIANNPIPVATTNPAAARQSAYSAVTKQPAALRPQYLNDHLGRQYLQQNGRLHVTATSASVSDPTGDDRTPLRYAGNLDALQQRTLGPDRYPVQRISNQQLDSIVSDIVYQHPDFIDATTHYGGQLVDPTPVQEQETKDLLKRLIDGRLHLMFGRGSVDQSDIAYK